MWTLIKRFFTDEQTFLSAMSIGGARLWALLVGASVVVGSGMVPELTTALGAAGAWGSKIVAGLAVVRAIVAARAAETPPAAKALAHIDPEQLKDVLRQLGVPTGVATAAAEKTAETPLPKV